MPKQRRRSRRGLQAKLAKAAGSFELLRLLLASVWFRIAAVGIMLILIGLVVLLVPFFRTTHKDVTPIFRASGLDFIQAKQLSDNAKEETKKGNFKKADYFWHAAMLKHPGSIEIAQGALENAFEAKEQDLKWLSTSLKYANQLMLLTQTNEFSLDYVSRFYEKRNLAILITELLEPRKKDLTPTQQGVLFRAFFKQRMFSYCNEFWFEMSEEAQKETRSRLYRAAYLAGWGKVADSVNAMQTLRDISAADPEHRILATQLLLIVYGETRDMESYGKELQKLRAAGIDQHFHHAVYWVLLLESNRPNVARHQAEDYWTHLVRKPLTSPRELSSVATAYNKIGLPERALDLFESFGEEFVNSTDYWEAYSEVLVTQENWAKLKVLALKIRSEGFASRVIRAYSYYLEGLSEAGEKRTYNAGRAFDSVIESEAKLNAHQAIKMAWQVYRIGYPEIASKLLANHRADLERNLNYWEITFASAYKLKRVDLIEEAAKRMMSIDPSHVVSQNNHMAALLVRRKRPEEAIRYTLQLYNQHPTQPGFILNHGLALLQNGRLDEAETMFRRLDPTSIKPELVTSLGFGWFELYFQKGNKILAEQALLDVSENQLFPEQLDWLQNAKAALGIGVEETQKPETAEPDQGKNLQSSEEAS